MCLLVRFVNVCVQSAQRAVLGAVMKPFPSGVCWHLRVKLPAQGLRLTLQPSDRRVGVVQPGFEDAPGGGVQMGKLLWDLVGVGSLLLLPLVPMWEAGR